MPLYEYECTSCGHRFEVIQKFSDAPIAACSACGGPVEKLLSSPAIQFKGSGFYLTDYGRGTRKPEGADAKTVGAGADTPAATKSEGSSTEAKPPSSSTTDAKPAAPAKSE